MDVAQPEIAVGGSGELLRFYINIHIVVYLFENEDDIISLLTFSTVPTCEEVKVILC